MLAAFASGLSFYDPSTGKQQRIHDIEADLPSTRLNDGRCDRRGRFFVGGYDTSGRGLAALYRLDMDLSLHQLFGGLCSANSTCFSPDGQTMYFADTPKREIWAIDYDPDSGCLGDRRTFCRFDDQPGMPDGSIIDAEGFLWNAQWNGARVVRYDKAGNIDRIIEMPCLNPTCLAFGGKTLDTLFITSARYQMSQEQILDQPQAGGLFAIKPGVNGLPESKFCA
jgi:L-arabinonolactonase